MENRIPTSTVTILPGYSLVVASYYQINAGVDVIVSAGADLLIY